MNVHDLMDAVGGIDSKFVDNAAKEARKPSVWKKLLPVAACFALLLGLWALHPWQAEKPTPDPGRLAAPVPSPTGRIEQTPEPDTDPTASILSPGEEGTEAPGPAPTEAAPEDGNVPAGIHGPDSGTSQGDVNAPAAVLGPDNWTPTNVTPMISGYGEMAYSGDLVVDNGGVFLSDTLRAAMDRYGDGVTYHIMIDLFHDGVQIPADGELAKRETERLCALGYTVAIETYTRDWGRESTVHFVLLSATQEQLLNFPPSGDLGYLIMLHDEYFGGTASGEAQVVFNGSSAAGN